MFCTNTACMCPGKAVTFGLSRASKHGLVSVKNSCTCQHKPIMHYQVLQSTFTFLELYRSWSVVTGFDKTTVEPLCNGHFGTNFFYACNTEVFLFWEAICTEVDLLGPKFFVLSQRFSYCNSKGHIERGSTACLLMKIQPFSLISS